MPSNGKNVCRVCQRKYDSSKDGSSETLCPAHYKRLKKYGDVRADVPIRDWVKGRTCRVWEDGEMCGEKHYAKDMCKRHYGIDRNKR